MQNVSPRVLVLDDDAQVRAVVAEMLRNGGMDVDTAGDGLAALDKIDATRFDLIVADLRLPGAVDGLDIVRCARLQHPCLRSLFISAELIQRLDDPETDDFVQKPFRPAELLGCAWELLLRRPSRPRVIDAKRLAERSLAAAKVDRERRQRGSE